MVQVSQDFVYHKNMASNQGKCTYILFYMLTRHFILLLYLGAKHYAEQIENRTVIFHQQAYKQPWIVSPIAPLATNLVSALETDHPNPFSLTYKAILSNPTLSTQSKANSNQSAATSASSTVEQVLPNPEHLQLTAGLTQDTFMAVDNILTQDYWVHHWVYALICLFSYYYSVYLFTNLLAFRIKCWRASVTNALLYCKCTSVLLVLHVL